MAYEQVMDVHAAEAAINTQTRTRTVWCVVHDKEESPEESSLREE
jgi:hypothetical protein